MKQNNSFKMLLFNQTIIEQKDIDNRILKKYVFDPLSTIIKLSILSNKPSNSKISIQNNIISIQEFGIFQAIVRYYWENNKEDLHYLAIPIFLACEKYLKKDFVEQIPEIKILFITAQSGLLKLMDTYTQYPLIVHCLQYYHTIINTYLGNEENNNLFNNFKKINNIENIKEIIMYEETTKIKTKEIIDNKTIHNKTNDTKIIHNKTNDTKTNEKTNDTKTNDTKTNEKTNDTKIIEKINDKIITNKIIETKVIDNKIKDKVASHNKVLMEFYTKEILTNFYLIWTESKIKIVIDMTKYLLGEKQAEEYAKSIEIFMIPVDNLVYSYVLEI
jgi:hypothetical protein